MQVVNDNKLIAEYMGEKIDLSKWGENWKRIINQYTTNEIPNYHNDWGWLMPVVEKITESNRNTEIRNKFFIIRASMPTFEGRTTMEAVYKGVVYYVKQQLKKTKKTKK